MCIGASIGTGVKRKSDMSSAGDTLAIAEYLRTNDCMMVLVVKMVTSPSSRIFWNTPAS